MYYNILYEYQNCIRKPRKSTDILAHCWPFRGAESHPARDFFLTAERDNAKGRPCEFNKKKLPGPNPSVFHEATRSTTWGPLGAAAGADADFFGRLAGGWAGAPKLASSDRCVGLPAIVVGGAVGREGGGGNQQFPSELHRPFPAGCSSH